ncbi:hypothetical protein ACWT_3385 [Actinoplanes sp. SE50]|uniref:DUF4192 domain-containing protein n=1 Tax=unclassified Actinoplanes TaxID=2626549 RepID=UPI00023ED232|nr:MULTISPECIES: DUF4192 domain-containing protein [unclassified Actinoplanes]AEV84408.1 hypothetical protein ACPL_3513 [Actinoplanes sp. SE50/110]ATO82800.1 hypothetical protein ACWT_3385 [Actinoplanes sp. SE50]SLM00208.1 hypothetical protein ACSP50_3440 [Actinoplanes sp. SE50/110]
MQRPEIRITSSADAATIVAYLLGYQPVNCLTVLAVADGTVAFAGAQALDGMPDPRAAAGRLATVVYNNGFTQVVLVGYGTHQSMRDPLQQAIDLFTSIGVTVLDAMRVDDGRLWHVGCGDPDCERNGVAFDPQTTIIAAEATFAGVELAPDRETLEARLDPITGEPRQRMRAAVARILQSTVLPIDHRRAMRLIDQLTQQALAGPLSDDDAAQLLVLLAFAELRNYAVHLVHGSDEDVHAWRDLTRRAGTGTLACTPATFLALAALQGGDGTTAAIAAGRARAADPDDDFAHLLERALQAGISPQALREVLHKPQH